MLDQKKIEDVSQYLRHGVIQFLLEIINPFNQTDSERLYHIATGIVAYLYTAEVLLTVNVSKCIKRPERFEERIAKQKMQTFEADLGRKEIQRPKWKSSRGLPFARSVWQSFVPLERGFIVHLFHFH